jgi:hypothetical protein
MTLEIKYTVFHSLVMFVKKNFLLVRSFSFFCIITLWSSLAFNMDTTVVKQI